MNSKKFNTLLKLTIYIYIQKDFHLPRYFFSLISHIYFGWLTKKLYFVFYLIRICFWSKSRTQMFGQTSHQAITITVHFIKDV